MTLLRILDLRFRRRNPARRVYLVLPSVDVITIFHLLDDNNYHLLDDNCADEVGASCSATQDFKRLVFV